jgi:hypothetical protein
MSDEIKGFNPEFDDYKASNVLYVGKENKKSDGSIYRKLEVILDQGANYLSDKNKEHESTPIKFSIKDDIILYSSDSGQQKIHCWLMESDNNRSINAINISRRTGKGVYGSQEVTLTLDAIIALKKFLDNLFYIDMTEKSKFKIPISELNCSIQSTFSKIISENEFIELIKANVKNTDDFYKLLSLQKMNIAVKRLEEIILGDYKNEVSIQKFLKENIWLFGNDYALVVENNKINSTNILDLIPQNIESYVDIIEVKLPSESLFNYDSSHQNYYPTSNLTKAIAQTQNYIFEMENKTHDEKYQEINNCRVVKPRGIILYGSGRELNNDEGKYLRILNSSYHNIKVITYQQLLEKARNTIAFSKSMDDN